MLERFLEKVLKQVMSLPTTVANCAVYAVSGIVPAEATIHKKALTLYGNICRLPDTAIEKQLAERQYILVIAGLLLLSVFIFSTVCQIHMGFSLILQRNSHGSEKSTRM